MPFDFEAVRWEDWNDERYDGKPSNVADVEGLLIHAWDVDTGESHHFWAFAYTPFQDWTEWMDYVGSLMEMHGMSL